MYAIKQIPEDFVVKEISNQKCLEKGKYLYFLLKKKNLGTLEAIKVIAQTLKVREKEIGFAGNKDKNAITEQVCSVSGVGKEKLEKIKLNAIELKFLGYGDKPISLGDLTGNYFEIVIRNLDDFKINKLNHFPNYFDEQRFSEHNVGIGKALLKKDFSEACSLIDRREVHEHLVQKPKDFIGAMKKLPIRLLRIYLNAYQSYLWNETLAEFLRQKGKLSNEIDYSQGKLVFVEDAKKFLDLEIPIIGFDSADKKIDSDLKLIIKNILSKEKISYSDFVIRQIPELTLEGEIRKAFTNIFDLKIGKTGKDELNSGKNKVKLSFSLGKGSYATMVVKAVLDQK